MLPSLRRSHINKTPYQDPICTHHNLSYLSLCISISLFTKNRQASHFYQLLMASSSSTFSAFRLIFLAFLCLIELGSAQLNSTYYSRSCPNVLSIIRGAVSTAVSNEARMGASLLRLHFHDCFVQGCDASVLLDGGEKNAPPNAGSLRGFNVIDTIKTQLESSCPGTVSCADILAVAARDSVVALGGPTWTVLLGRRDSPAAASNATVISNIPSFLSDLSSLIGNFSNKGFTTREMVALSGGHTIGQARCTRFRNRIYNENTTINSAFATTRQGNCPPTSGGDDNLAPLDGTPTVFDNRYFTDLVNQRGLLHSDQQLYLTGGSTNSIVTTYSNNGATFRTDFANAMIKMGNLSPLTGTSGQVRTNCRRAN